MIDMKMTLKQAIAQLENPHQHELVLNHGELTQWLKELQKSKQYLAELLEIIDAFGLKDICRCGRVNNSCKNCIYFSEVLNHSICDDDVYFTWKHKAEACFLVDRK